MRFFTLVRSGIDVTPLLSEVRSQEQLFGLNPNRQDNIKAQRDTNTIFISAQVKRRDLPPNENQETKFTLTSRWFPRCVAFLSSFAGDMNARVSRATIVRLKPGSQVLSHVDLGSYYLIRDRYHLVLYSATGSPLISGGEKVRMQTGELWWVNNKQYHEAHNDSDEWRIHLIFDLLPAAFTHLAVNPIRPRLAATTVAQVIREEEKTQSGPRELLRSAIRERAILRAEHQRLIGPDGSDNSWLIDMRRLFMDAQLLHVVSALFLDLCADRMPFQVGCMEVAAIPLLTAILIKSADRGTPINGFVVRKERKTYGAGNLLEGTVGDEPIIVVDDILNSGSSLEKIRVVLSRENKRIALAFAVIDYGSPKGLAWRQRHAIPVQSLFDLAEFDLRVRTPKPAPYVLSFRNVWNFAAPDPNFFHRVPKSSPATDGRHVYFGSDCGTFWCLNASNGSVAWQFKVNARGHKNIWSAPALNTGRVFFGSYDGNVYCLDAENGREIWRFTGADWVGSSPSLAPDLRLLFIGLEFAVEGKRGSIIALNLDTGEMVWEHPTKRYTHASPTYWPARRLVACGSNDNELFLLDAVTGAMHWRFETLSNGLAKGSIRHAPAFDFERGQLVTGCANGCIYVIDVDTGREVWSVQTDNTIYTVPLVVNNTAYVGSTDKYLYVLDLEQRRVRKKIYAGSKIFGPPRLLEGRIYFGACNGVVYALDRITDEITGMHQLPDAVTNALAYNPETHHFYALTYVNQLFAFTNLEQRGPGDSKLITE